MPAENEKMLTRAEVQAKRRKEAEGEEYILAQTGTTALVRKPSLLDASIIGLLPKSSQNEVAAFWSDVVQARGGVTISKDGETTVGMGSLGIMATLSQRQGLADDLCVVCFVKPRIFKTEADRDEFAAANPAMDPYAWVVTDMATEERLSFLMLSIEGMGGLGDSRLKSADSKPVGNVPAKPDEQAPAPGLGNPETI